MRTDSVNQFVSIRAALLKERASLEARLVRIKQALDGARAGTRAAAAAAPAKRRYRRRRARNKLSMAEAVLKATAAKPLAKAELLEAVRKLGYKFTAKDPLNSLSTVLYSNKRIKNHGGKFGPA